MRVDVWIDGLNRSKLNENLVLDVATSCAFHPKEVWLFIFCLLLCFKGLWVKPIHVADSISILFNIAPLGKKILEKKNSITSEISYYHPYILPIDF